MDQAFPAHDWQPTKPPELGEEDLSSKLPGLISLLNHQTRCIYDKPYQPRFWYDRAQTHTALRYPELAAGDAEKAIKLCSGALDRLGEDGNPWRLGHAAGFWMRSAGSNDDDDDDDDDEMVVAMRDDQLEQRLANLQCEAFELQTRNLYYYPNYLEGRIRSRLYPWMREEHRGRSDELIRRVNREFARPSRGKGKEIKACNGVSPDERAPFCVLRRYAFGNGARDGQDGSDVLGVFAARDIPKGTPILVDPSETWGCIGPGSKRRSTGNPHDGRGCTDPIHPNLPYETTSQDLRWIRERTGSAAADVLLRCRFLIHSIRDQVPHPLSHPLIARLTPTYRQEKTNLFSLEHDIVVPNECLQQFGIDIFADPAYDTWVLFTLAARIENNSWSDPVHKCVSPLFSLFNHSCEPNVDWTIGRDHTTLWVSSSREVARGEQLFVVS
ncbi:hypothetical protein KC343_g8368 [Hortaea werneckii]|uniref:SET domain-containing protein n=1 Tax=Hortaea werneckii TaxID=91943 RepID=A0A3M7C8K9_HORWE|nr:hypothetical protein KC352_g16304 [Hortaea werneckii]KAI7562034.1 hypothetical protein KC317_g8679 [Hortaea werneckii]KAI7611450.1 hypothetical protein KC346_g8275 [Hortaea werneckii]KAI7620479.1 hypothetical protein KC343_g8368 [Hortaea werneckii]KAI7682558.1 hypothetical protein KC319_g942 [Hortaea werneckii]